MNKALPVELTLSISAMIIAIASITISIWEGSTMRKHYHLSVMPRLNNSFTVNDSSSTINASAIFTITNNGLGPAVILSREYFVDGNKIDDSKNHFSVILDSTLNFDNTAGSTFSSIPKGTTISVGENQFVDDGMEDKDIITPDISLTPRDRPPAETVEVACHVCNKTYQVNPVVLGGEFYRCDKCVDK